MATSAVLEDTITCCICFNVYRNPHTLPCLHTLCKPCIDQLVVRGKVECPECRETTDLNKIRKDFRIQNLIDDQKNTECAKEETSTVCGMCNEKDKGIVSHCQECEHYMCGGCEKGHNGMRVCRGHTVKPVKDIIKIAQSKLEEGVAQWKKENTLIADKASKIEVCIKSIQNQREQQIDKTGKHFDKLIADLERKRASLIKDIRQQNRVTIQDLRKTKEIYDQMSVEINTKLQILSEIINKKDITTLNDMGNEMETSLQVEINSIRYQVNHCFAEDLSPIELVTNDTKQLEPGIRIEQRLTGNNLSPFPEASSDYTKLATSKYKLSKDQTLEGIQNILRVKVISNNLWCAAYKDGIRIYNKNLEFIKDIKNDNHSYVTSISEWGEHVLVSCSDGHGLHLIEQSGKYLHKIAGGDFTDVCSSDKKVFAFDHKRKQLIVYEQKYNIWNEIQRIDFENIQNIHTKFSVSHGKLFISVCNSNHIQQYNLQGNLELILGSEGSQAAELKYPILCSADMSGNFLVADKNNNRLQVYLSRPQTWHSVNLQSDIILSRPYDAVVDNNCDNIWVVTYITGKDQHLVRFSRKLDVIF